MSNSNSKRGRSTSAAIADIRDEPEASTSKRPRSLLKKETATTAVGDDEEQEQHQTYRNHSVNSRSPPLRKTTTTITTTKPQGNYSNAQGKQRMMDGGNSSRSNRNTVDRASTEVIDGPGDNGHRLPPQSTLPKSAREIQLLSDDYADLELRCREIQENFDALRREHERILSLRETEAEAALREITAANASRTDALRKQVSTYAKEGEELREQIDSLHEERRQLLREKQELQRRQSNGDAEKGDEANMEVDSDDNDDDSRTGGSQRRSSRRAKDRKSPKLVVDPEALENLQQENDTLRTLNESLEQQVNQLTSDVEDSLKEKKVLKQKWEAERINLEKSLKDIFETQKKDLVREKEEFAMRNQQLEKELAFEVEQSKKLQAIGAGSQSQSAHQRETSVPSSKSAGASTSITTAATTGKTSANNGGNDDELIQLLLDLTGLTLVRKPTEVEDSYNFLMSDYRKRKTLNFKLHLDRELGQVDFIPDLLPGRDDEVIENMEKAIRGHIKFEYEMMQTFFKRLWRALNGHK